MNHTSSGQKPGTSQVHFLTVALALFWSCKVPKDGIPGVSVLGTSIMAMGRYFVLQQVDPQ